jgi:hypothetical protein
LDLGAVFHHDLASVQRQDQHMLLIEVFHKTIIENFDLLLRSRPCKLPERIRFLTDSGTISTW